MGRFPDDAGETNARRSKCAPGSSDGTDYFYDVTSRARGCPRDEIPPSRRRVTNLRRERERSNPPRATDNDLPPRDRNTSRLPFIPRRSYLITYYDDRRLDELIGRGHREGKGSREREMIAI